MKYCSVLIHYFTTKAPSGTRRVSTNYYTAVTTTTTTLLYYYTTPPLQTSITLLRHYASPPLRLHGEVRTDERPERRSSPPNSDNKTPQKKTSRKRTQAPSVSWRSSIQCTARGWGEAPSIPSDGSRRHSFYTIILLYYYNNILLNYYSTVLLYDYSSTILLYDSTTRLLDN